MEKMLPQQRKFLERIKKIKAADIKTEKSLKDIVSACQDYLKSWNTNVCDKYLNKDKLKKPQGLNAQSTDDWVYINNIKGIIDDFNTDVSEGHYDLQDICDMLGAMATVIKPSKTLRPWCNAPSDRIWKSDEVRKVLKKHADSLKKISNKLEDMVFVSATDETETERKYAERAKSMYQTDGIASDNKDSTKFSKEKLIFLGLVSKIVPLQLKEDTFFAKNIKPLLDKVDYTDYSFKNLDDMYCSHDVPYEIKTAIGRDVFNIMNNEIIRYTGSWVCLCKQFVKKVKVGKGYIEDLENKASDFNRFAKNGYYYDCSTNYDIYWHNFSSSLKSIKDAVWAFSANRYIDEHIASLDGFGYARIRIIHSVPH